MKKIALAASAAVAALCMASGAQAAVDNIVLAGIGSSDAYSTDDATASDIFNFTVPTAGILSAAFGGVPDAAFTSITGGLYSGSVLLSPFAFMELGNSKLGSLAATSVAAGDYSLRFFNVTAGAGYGGSVTLSAAPVPEPASWALMIAGLAAAGVAMRNRSKNVRVAFS
jgi:hypothetical protein